MGTPSFSLFCEYIHCCGKKTLHLGNTHSLAEARQWADKRNRTGKRPSLPADDLIRTCPVRHCPAKLQIPRYGFSSGPGE